MDSFPSWWSLFIVVSALGCTESISEPVAVATSIEVSEAMLSFEILGSTIPLMAIVLDQNGQELTAAPVGWASSPDGVASVSTTGVVTAEGVGMTTVTATSGAATLDVEVAVSTVSDTVEVDGRLYGSLLSGLPTLAVSVSSGTSSITLIRGNFVAWSFAFGSAGTWRTHYRVYFPDSTFLDGGDPLMENDADAAFDATSARVMELTVPSDQDVKLGVPDNKITDNVGGVTLVFRHIRR